MELTLTADSKYKVYNYPPALPNKCVGCHASHPGDSNNRDSQRAFIDTGISLEWYGAVYICTFCFIEMGNAFGWVSPEQYASAKYQLSIEHKANQSLIEENEALRTAVSSLADHRCASPIEPDVPSIPEPDSGGEEDEPAPVDIGVEEKSDTPEPDNVRRLPDVRGNAAGNASAKRKPDAFNELGL